MLFGWCLLALAVVFWDFLLPIWIAVGGFFVLLMMIDAWFVRRLPTPQLQRTLPNSLAVGIWSTVTLEIMNLHRTSLQVKVFDDYPLPSEFEGLPAQRWLPSKTKWLLSYRLCPQRRGQATFAGVFLQMTSPSRWWIQTRYIILQDVTRIYPYFAPFTKLALLAAENRLGQLGIRQMPRRGEGLEFHQLREYRSGDVLRQVDWNATSRLKKLISKEYQDERDQQIIFLLDCGRRMLAQDAGLSHFDHSLNAVLLLAYVALRQGDGLGLMTFSGEQRWVAPKKGVQMSHVILNTVYDIYPSLQTSDYWQAANRLNMRQKRRALVILVTNLREEDSEELLPAVQLLQKKHLLIVASLQEQILSQVLVQPTKNFSAALRQASVYEYLQQRQRIHEHLQQQGIICLDVAPPQLPVAIVNHYLKIKRSRRL